MQRFVLKLGYDTYFAGLILHLQQAKSRGVNREENVTLAQDSILASCEEPFASSEKANPSLRSRAGFRKLGYGKLGDKTLGLPWRSGQVGNLVYTGNEQVTTVPPHSPRSTVRDAPMALAR
jgi:hypothetical protein